MAVNQQGEIYKDFLEKQKGFVSNELEKNIKWDNYEIESINLNLKNAGLDFYNDTRFSGFLKEDIDYYKKFKNK